MKRKKILAEEETTEIFERPLLDEKTRADLFSLSIAELNTAESIKSLDHKVLFILGLGYFKARRRIFPYSRKDDLENCRYIERQYFKLRRKNWTGPKPFTGGQAFRISSKILQVQGYSAFNQNQRKKFAQIAGNFIKISPKPNIVVRRLLWYLESNKVALPSYSTVQDVVGDAVTNERRRLQSVFSETVDSQARIDLVSLFEKEGGLHRLTMLKRDPKNFGYSQIQLEVLKQKNLKSAYKFSQELIPKLSLSSEAIAYYASLVMRTSPQNLKKFDGDLKLCLVALYVNSKIKRINNDLIKSLFIHVSRIKEKAKDQSKEELARLYDEAGQRLQKAEKVWSMFTDREIIDTTSFGEIRSDASRILSIEDFNFVHLFMKQAGFDKEALYWDQIESLAPTFKRNIRQIIKNTELSCSLKSSPTFTVTGLVKAFLLKNKSLRDFPESQFKKIVNSKSKRYFYNEFGEMKVDRFEYLLYSKIQTEFDKGHIYCPNSTEFRSLEDDLISQTRWKNDKNRLLEQAGLKHLQGGPQKTLKAFKKKLDKKYKKVNSNINNGLNTFFEVQNDEKKKKKKWKLKYKNRVSKTEENFFKNHPQVGLNSLLTTTEKTTKWMSAFKHVSGRDVKPEQKALLATIVALGTNLGTSKMASISDVEFKKLSGCLKGFVDLEQVRKANDLVTDSTARLPTFARYNVNGKIHGSSDGQKFEVDRPTAKARYSPKYFGLRRGVSAYCYVVNHIPANSTVIGANEHESHFVFDILFGNTSEIDPALHSTDSHGLNSLNFLVLDQFGIQFAPRYKNINRVMDKLVGFGDVKASSKGHVVAPAESVKDALIAREWDNILRILVSLSLKECSQSTIVRKLSNKRLQNQTQKALWEWDSIIESMYILDYIDSEDIRQNVHYVLNRGESYHALRRAVSVANSRSFRPRSDAEIELWNECSRLIANLIIHYNTLLISKFFSEEEEVELPSPVSWAHINFLGSYIFGEETEIDLDLMQSFLVPQAC